MKVAHTLALLGVNLAVSACVAGPPPGPIGVVAPGKDKSQAAFQQDQSDLPATCGRTNRLRQCVAKSSRPSSSGRNGPRLSRRLGQRRQYHRAPHRREN